MVVRSSLKCAKKTLSHKKVPGPIELPFLGHAHLFSPLGKLQLWSTDGALIASFAGSYSIQHLVDAHADLHKRYGRIVRLRLGIPLYLLFHPDDARTLCRSEGKEPKRPLFDALRHYRASRPDKYRHMGLVTENGPKWSYLRKQIQFILRPSVAQTYISAQEAITEDFIQYLDRIRQPNGRIHNLLPHLYLYTQEIIGDICFGTRLGCFGDQAHDALVLAKNVTDLLDAMGTTMLSPPLWKIIKTTSYRKLEQTQDYLWKCSVNYLDNAKKNLKNPDKHPFLKGLLESELDPLDVALLINEMFQAGIEAVEF